MYIARGRKVSRKVDLKVPFGTIVAVASEERSTSNYDSRGALAIAVGRDADTRGACVVWLLANQRFCIRPHVRVTAVTDDIIDKINRIARGMEIAPDRDIAVINGKPITDEVISVSPHFVPLNSTLPTIIPRAIVSRPIIPPEVRHVPNDILPIAPPVVARVEKPPVVVTPIFPPQVSPSRSTTPSPPLIAADRNNNFFPLEQIPVDATSPPVLANLPLVIPIPPPNISTVEVCPPQPSNPPNVRGLRINEDGMRRSTRDRKPPKDYSMNFLACSSFLSLAKAEKEFPGLAVKAATKEMVQLIDSKTIVPVLFAPRDQKIIHSQLMITPKYGLDGLLDKVKGRLVACCDEVDPSAYKSASETSAPTLKFESLMVLLSAASFEHIPDTDDTMFLHCLYPRAYTVSLSR